VGTKKSKTLTLISSIIDDCKKMGLPEPEYKYTFHSVQVVFHKTTQKTTKEQILELLSSDGKMTREELAESIGVSANAIKQHLANLQTEKKLKRVGGRKDGYWKVIAETR
jgi:ATP-dependent DNA helicase RecG